MAIEVLVWPGPPTITNGRDGDQDYNLGIRFSVTEDVPCVGLQWARTPDSITPPNGGTHVAGLWTVVGETRLAFKNFVPPPATDDYDVDFDAPVNLVAGQLYVASIFSRDYVYRASGGAEVSSPSGTMTADQGKLAASGEPATFPASNQNAYYFISPRIDLGGDDPAEGSVDLGLDLAVSSAGARASAGAAGLGLGLSAAATGARPAQGVAAFSLGLALAAAGRRASGGSADLGLGLAVAAQGVRAARGQAALGLGLAVAATGSDGDSGRPVKPFPFTPSPVAGFPWEPRPVKSFTEVTG